jgi:enolase
MAKISDIEARQILDSRGEPTVEVKITTDDGIMATDSVPSGTSTGSFEAKAIDPQLAVNNINQIIKPKLLGMDPTKQKEVDQTLLDLDGTSDKSKLGANAILGVSLCVARTGAATAKMPLYWHLNKLYQQASGTSVEPAIPTPMMVMIEGGKHGKNNICIQEFLVISKLENGRKIWNQLKKVIQDSGQDAKLGLEGGFQPHVKYDEDAIEMIISAIKDSGFKIDDDVKLGLDVAANNCQISHEDIMTMMARYPIYSIEDPVGEDDWDHWAQMKLELDQKKKDYLLIGDDLFVTNKQRLEKGINNMVANGIIIKVNQTGSLWETLEVIALAKKSGYKHILSHRSGETMDTFIADLAVATAAPFMKSGAPFASEREIKYKRLEEISKEL